MAYNTDTTSLELTIVEAESDNRAVFNASSYDKVRCLKAEIEEVMGIPSSEFRLTYNEKELSNSNKIGYHCSNKTATLQLIPCKPWIYIILQVHGERESKKEGKVRLSNTVREITDTFQLQLGFGIELDNFATVLNDHDVLPDNTFEELAAISGDMLHFYPPSFPRCKSYANLLSIGGRSSTTTSTYECCLVYDTHSSDSVCPPAPTRNPSLHSLSGRNQAKTHTFLKQTWHQSSTTAAADQTYFSRAPSEKLDDYRMESENGYEELAELYSHQAKVLDQNTKVLDDIQKKLSDLEQRPTCNHGSYISVAVQSSPSEDEISAMATAIAESVTLPPNVHTSLTTDGSTITVQDDSEEEQQASTNDAIDGDMIEVISQNLRKHHERFQKELKPA